MKTRTDSSDLIEPAPFPRNSCLWFQVFFSCSGSKYRLDQVYERAGYDLGSTSPGMV